MADSLYAFDGERFLPGPLTVGPWSPDAQHGGPVAALLSRAAEGAVDPVFAAVAVQTVRITVELVKPVPLAPLLVTATVVRPGRRVQLVEVSVEAGGEEVARARALRIRRQAMEVPLDLSAPAVPPPASWSAGPGSAGPGSAGPGSTEAPPSPPGLPSAGEWDVEGAIAAKTSHSMVEAAPPPRTAFIEAVDLRFVKGGWDELGPVTMWTRLKVPVVAGETPSPLQRTAAAADFGNGVSRILEFDRHIFINPDLTVALARVPEGEWIGFDVLSRMSGDGFGQAESQIFDGRGPVGRAIQSLLVAER